MTTLWDLLMVRCLCLLLRRMTKRGRRAFAYEVVTGIQAAPPIAKESQA